LGVSLSTGLIAGERHADTAIVARVAPVLHLEPRKLPHYCSLREQDRRVDGINVNGRLGTWLSPPLSNAARQREHCEYRRNPRHPAECKHESGFLPARTAGAAAGNELRAIKIETSMNQNQNEVKQAYLKRKQIIYACIL
jgi:hypothetical protein